MHCPSCGADAPPGWKFCKRCGANLNPPTHHLQSIQQEPSSGRLTGVAWAMALATVAITLGGLGIVFSHAFDLVRPAPPGYTSAGSAEDVAMMMVLLGSLTIFGVVAILTRLLSRAMGWVQPKTTPVQMSNSPVNEYRQPQIPAPPANVSSVTEHTTRNFDPQRLRDSGARE